MTPHPDCPSTARHGTTTAYHHDRCRCPAARALATREKKAYLVRRLAGDAALVHPAGTRRRITALVAAGWSYGYQAAHLGISRTAMIRMVTEGRGGTRPVTAEAVARMYRELSETPGPSVMAASKARALGYAPPIAWDDDAIDDPAGLPWAVIDDHGNLTHRVGSLAVRRCARAGCTWWAVGPARHCSARCVRALLESEERRARRRASWRATAVRKRARARQGVAA